jgi:Protein of unknown function (DUF3147)
MRWKTPEAGRNTSRNIRDLKGSALTDAEMHEMWEDLGIRFLLGGVLVSLFALVGDVCKPKSFAGLFSAAPSVALATLGLAFLTHGGTYTSLEGRSMLAGAIALLVYSQVVSHLIMRWNLHSAGAAARAIVLWAGTAFGIWWWALQ